ncbi:LuxE/PaaK family acyltransferase [Algicola sagamiensis]|uniref:LuxE/PaaK family acyltransferase n=1 Tax=Algicola sagamiensis TaxID=163869 RepID=UPI00037FC56A|nr:hypothetical protein [Algicola sagamiensis]
MALIKLTPPKDNDLTLENLYQLVSLNNPYQSDEHSDQLFYQAMKEVIQWHQKKSNYYQALCQQESYTECTITSKEDLGKIPYLMAHLLKRHEILSIDVDEVDVHLTSSGTTGQKSQMFFDAWSLGSAQVMVDNIFDYYGWNTPEQEVDYLLYSYEPMPGFKVGTSYTDNFLCKYAPARNVTYALKNMGDGHEFDLFGCIRAIEKSAQDQVPLRIFGFPSFLFFTLEKIQNLSLKFSLHPESFVFLGGGWKGHQDKVIEKSAFYPMVTDLIGIPDHRLRDGFGSVEHCVPYVECEHHQFHIPTYARVLIRDVMSFSPLGYGEVGLLNFVSPYITSSPAHSIVMGDLAKLHPGDSCPCGIQTDFFQIIGRAGNSKSKSCAVAANEFLKESQHV